MNSVESESFENGVIRDEKSSMADESTVYMKTMPEEPEYELEERDLGNSNVRAYNKKGVVNSAKISTNKTSDKSTADYNVDSEIYYEEIIEEIEEEIIEFDEIVEIEEMEEEAEVAEEYYGTEKYHNENVGELAVVEKAKERKVDNSEAELFMIVEEQPEFPGGEKALMEFIYKNISYPKLAKENSIEGTCYVSFVVQEDGSVSDIEIKRDIGGGCGEVAKSIVKKMPKWKPGKQRGRNVPVTFNLPIKFQLDGGYLPSKPFEKPKPRTRNFSDKMVTPVAENDFISTTEKPLSTFSIDVDNASYSLLRKNLNYDKLPNPHAIRIEEMINYFEYDYPKPQGNIL